MLIGKVFRNQQSKHKIDRLFVDSVEVYTLLEFHKGTDSVLAMTKTAMR